MFTSAHDSLYTTAVTKKKMLEQEYMISSWSVADCVSLSASKSKHLPKFDIWWWARINLPINITIISNSFCP